MYEKMIEEEFSLQHPGNHFKLDHLAPAFFSRQMNISIDVLVNLFAKWHAALSGFLNKHFTAFDALVGENACHIRAAYLIELNKKMKNASLKTAIETVIEELQLLITLLPTVVLTHDDTQHPIKTFLNKYQLSFCIPNNCFKEIKFILDSYLLTLTKEDLPRTGFTLHERTNYHRLRDLGIVKNKAKTLVCDAQKSLSKACCEYMQSEALYLDNPALAFLLRIKRDAHERSFLPQFTVAKVFFQRALSQNTHLLVKVTRCLQGNPFEQYNLCFKPNISHTDFEHCKTMPKDTPCIIAAGVVNYESDAESKQSYLFRLLSHSMLNVLYGNFAMHPQYSGELKALPPPFIEAIELVEQEIAILETLQGDKQEIAYLQNLIEHIRIEADDYVIKKNFAVEHGCSLANPSLLFFNHMYADLADNHLIETAHADKRLRIQF